MTFVVGSVTDSLHSAASLSHVESVWQLICGGVCVDAVPSTTGKGSQCEEKEGGPGGGSHGCVRGAAERKVFSAGGARAGNTGRPEMCLPRFFFLVVIIPDQQTNDAAFHCRDASRPTVQAGHVGPGRTPPINNA